MSVKPATVLRVDRARDYCRSTLWTLLWHKRLTPDEGKGNSYGEDAARIQVS